MVKTVKADMKKNADCIQRNAERIGGRRATHHLQPSSTPRTRPRTHSPVDAVLSIGPTGMRASTTRERGTALDPRHGGTLESMVRAELAAGAPADGSTTVSLLWLGHSRDSRTPLCSHHMFTPPFTTLFAPGRFLRLIERMLHLLTERPALPLRRARPTPPPHTSWLHR